MALLTALALACPALAEDGELQSEHSDLARAFDLLVTRPLGLGRILYGVVCFIPAALFAEVPPVLGGDSKRWRSSIDESWQILVGDQADVTFNAPLGELEGEY